MCMACEEMDMYYAYIEAMEAEKRKAQDWQCEVTLFPQGSEVPADQVQAGQVLADEVPPYEVPADEARAARPAGKHRVSSPFACDEAE